MTQLDFAGIKELAKSYGNGFYILDSHSFSQNFLELRNAFQKQYPNFNIAYSYKTNYTPKLCGIVNQLGGYAEVVSEMELELAYKVGVAPEKIIWNGPVKNKCMVAQLLLAGGTVNIDSCYELPFLNEVAKANPQATLNIGIRCNFDVGDGTLSRFGIDTSSEDFARALDFFRARENVHLINIQCHFAKRNVEYWPARAEAMVSVARHVESVLGYLPDRIDIGGGLYGKMADSLKVQFPNAIPVYEDYALAAATIFARNFPDCKPELLIEPGSALVGDCMKFVGRIETIKSVRGKIFATMWGSQKNISMGGVNPPIEIVRGDDPGVRVESADIVGYTCIEGDVIYRNFSGELAVGDYVVINNCGSYSIVMKPPFILPNFPVLDIGGDSVEVIKCAESFDDVFHTYSF